MTDPSLLPLLTILMVLAGTGNTTFVRNFPWQFKGFPSAASSFTSTDSLLRRVQYLEGVVEKLATQECRTGVVDVTFCDRFPTHRVDPAIFCIAVTNGPQNETITVPLEPSYHDVPHIIVGMSGLSVFAGKNCTIRVENVTPTSFDLRVIVDDLQPLSMSLMYMACPPAIKQPTGRLSPVVETSNG